jgi:hypothetical protein
MIAIRSLAPNVALTCGNIGGSYRTSLQRGVSADASAADRSGNLAVAASPLPPLLLVGDLPDVLRDDRMLQAAREKKR